VLDDDELLSLVRSGDRHAYGVLYRRNYRVACAVARHASTGLDVEDVVSEAFMKVLGAIIRGSGPRYGFRAYLMASIRAVAATRGVQRAVWSPADVPDLADPDDALEKVEDRLDSMAVWAVLEQLPERWQPVLRLAALEDRSPAQIGAQLGISANNASAILYRARKRMRELWAQSLDHRPESCETN